MIRFSFWADEAFVSGVAKLLVTGNTNLIQSLNFLGIYYQRLYYLTLAFFFSLFGLSEFVARLPSLIFFCIGIFTTYKIGKMLTCTSATLLMSFLYSFSHLNLSYATQAKPYIILETLFLVLVYVCISKWKHKVLLCAFISLVATFFHVIGVLFWVFLLIYILMESKQTQLFNYKRILIIYSIIFILVIVSVGVWFFYNFKLLQYNHSYQFIKLFFYKYSLITIPAALGFLLSYKKDKSFHTSIALYSLSVFILSTFQQYIFNIRYVLTLFGILFLYFGIFWGWVAEKYGSNFKFKIYNVKLSGKSIIPLLVIIVIYATGYKVVRGPQAYYNPNIDKYGDVQIANYKDFYAELKRRFPNYRSLYVVNNIFDTESWYFGRYSNAYFMKFTEKPYKHHTANAMVYGSLDDFKKVISEHPQGLLIMEDWQSFLPDDVKEYAKKNLRLEFRVESLREAPDDPWPLALYSWGMEK